MNRLSHRPAKDPVQDAYAQGVAFHREGHLTLAEQCYRAVLADSPRHPGALDLLGLLAHQSGHSEAGLQLIDQAIALLPRNGEFHEHRAQALRGLGQIDAAIESLERACKLGGKSFGAHHNLGTALFAAGRYRDAVEPLRKAVRLMPAHAGARNNLGNAQRLADDKPNAAENFREALRLEPANHEFAINLGRTLIELRQTENVESLIADIESRDPTSPALDHLRALRASVDADLSGACTFFERALQQRPDDPALNTDYAGVLRWNGQFDKAEPMMRIAIERWPGVADTWINLGFLLTDVGRTDEAIKLLRHALSLYPDNVSGYYALAFALLQTEQYDEGFEQYESRWMANNSRPPRDNAPWEGEAAPDKLLLIEAEQGYGDNIQFARFVTLAASRMRVVLRTRPDLLRLMRTLDGPESIITTDDPAPDFDAYCPIMSLPRALKCAIPNDTPYLAADPAATASWRARLDSLPGRKVGLVWAGNPGYGIDYRRTIPFADLEGLVGLEHITFISLQKGTTRPDSELPDLIIHDWTDELADFTDTASLIEALDLVVSVDTAVAHLAGSLGRPVWLLNRFDADWRWQRGRSDSVWYPSMRQFRQPETGNWRAPIAELAAALREL